MIQNFSFNPASLSVPTGTKVTVTNQDGVTHTWTADTGQWNSGALAPGQSFSFTFTAPGSFSYHCSIHSYMTGVVTVG